MNLLPLSKDLSEERGNEDDALAAPVMLVPRSLNANDAAGFVRAHFNTGTYSDRLKDGKSFNKGTTCLAFLYSGGVIVSVDSRASQGWRH